MFRSTDPHHTRKTIAGVCMVLAPLFLLASAVVSPKLDTHEAGMLSNAADHLDRFYLSTMLGAVAVILLVPAVLGLMHMLRERRTGAGLLGGGLALFGAMAAMAGTGVNLVLWQMASGGNRGEMVALLHRVNHTTGTFIPLYICTLGIVLGFAVMSYALMAERMVHWSMAAAMTLGTLAVTIAFMAGSLALLIIGAAIFFVGLASVGRMILLETDEDWEHTPEFRGFGLAGTA
jgi:MFS family permease